MYHLEMAPESLRRRIVEIDDVLRQLPADAFADRHVLNSERDNCRSRLRTLLSDDLDAASNDWAERASRKGEHSVDEGERAAAAKIVSPGEGAGGS